MRTATKSKPRWKREAPGMYISATPCGHTLVVRKTYGGWGVYLEGGYRHGSTFPTLSEAKAWAGDPLNLVALRSRLKQRKADESAKALAERRDRGAFVIRECRLADSRSAPVGLPWFAWAERRVGTTAAEIRQANDSGAKEAFLEYLDEHEPDAVSIYDWHREWAEAK